MRGRERGKFLATQINFFSRSSVVFPPPPLPPQPKQRLWLRRLLSSIIINYPFTRESGGFREGKEVLVGEGGWIEIKEGMGGGRRGLVISRKIVAGKKGKAISRCIGRV